MRIDIEEVKRRKEHHERMGLAGIDDPLKIDLGPYVLLWRQFRGIDKETWEILPTMMAEWTLGAIPINEPSVARAALYRRAPSNVPLAIFADLIRLKMSVL